MAWHRDIERSWHVGDELPSHNDGCAVCGSHSASSPLLERFRMVAQDTVGARVRFDERHQGAPLYAHGGAVAAVLDDACGYLSFVITRMFVTAHLEVDYRRPVLLGDTYEVRAVCTEIDGRKVHAQAELSDPAGLVAEATALFVVVDVEHFRP